MYTVYIISNAFALLKARFKYFMCLFVAKKLNYFSDWRSCDVLSSVPRSLGPLGGSRDGSGLAAIKPRSCTRPRIDTY
jgi:hypothetical protein